MMKQLESITLVTIAMFFFGSPALAGPEVSLIWRANGTDTLDPSVDGFGSQILDVVLSSDATAVGGVFISFLFDEDLSNELNFVSGDELLIVKIAMGNSYSPLAPGVTDLTESSSSSIGVIGGFDLATLSTGLASATVTLGSLVFAINAALADGVDVRPVIRMNGIDGITEANTGNDLAGITTFKGAFVPEPTTALLIVLGLTGLGVAGRRVTS